MVSACLSIPGDGIHELSLFITYEGEGSVMIKILAPAFLTANPVEVSVSKGRSETVHFSIDFTHEDALSNIEGIQNKFINITSMHGNCTVEVPIEYLINSMRDTRPQFSSILPVMEPKILLYGFAFVIVLSFLGAWLCFKCRGQRQGEVKYQQLEMNGLDAGTPKESMEQRSGSADGWDEVWDDDWEDSEAAKSSSHLSQSVSSRGLAARRGVKDGWETSWDD
ncbi:hypothetical protein KP509_39G057000 [Ceratopteris richardii]|nr:hypothetical protein KP509_39G057000 [Ceratopteris richardii]